MTVLRAGAATDVGRVRSVNQDRLLIGDGLFAVADGMGGHAGGEVAARLAVETLRDEFARGGGTEPLLAAIRRANQVVWERSRSDAELRGMGTTVTAVALIEDGDRDELVVANVGDSRAYLLQNGELSQLTADHSLVEEMVRAGELSEAEAVGHPHRHILTRALGIDPDIEVDSWQIAPHPGDRLLLCSDGLVNEVDDTDIAAVLRSEADPDRAAEILVERARAHGGADNITVVIVDVAGEDVASPDGAGTAAAVEPAVAAEPAAAVEPAVAVAADPGAPAAAPARTPTRAEPDEPRPRRVTVRVVVFLIALLVVLGGAVAAVVWYARDSYYVGLAGGSRITVYQGRPGGVLWLKPTVAARTPYTADEVLASRVPDLRQGKLEGSRQEALRYVANLVSEAQQAKAAAAPAPGVPPAPGSPAAPPPATSTTARPAP